MVKSVSYKHSIRVSACQVTWEHLTVNHCISAAWEATYKSGLKALEDCLVGCKNSDKGSKMKSKKLLEGTKVNNILPGDRSLICPP